MRLTPNAKNAAIYNPKNSHMNRRERNKEQKQIAKTNSKNK
jgi:hypothetical protein